MMKTVRLFTAGGRTVKSSPIITSLKFKAAARTTTSTSSGPAAPASGAFFEMQRLQIAAHVNVQMTLHSVGPQRLDIIFVFISAPQKKQFVRFSWITLSQLYVLKNDA